MVLNQIHSHFFNLDFDWGRNLIIFGVVNSSTSQAGNRKKIT